ncbi:PASTA domain-containing protein [Arthrobacter sp. HLT1-20]
MAFSLIGLVVGAALARDVQDRARASQIEILGGVLGASPMGLVLLTTLAKEATESKPTDPKKPKKPTEASVPDVSDAEDLTAAEGMLKAHGLVVGQQQYVLSDSTPDAILGSSPEAGTLVSLGAKVSILVNAGLIVPDVTGIALTDAQLALDAACFQCEVEFMDLPGKPGEVAKQDPGAGELAFSGDIVILSVVETPPERSSKTSSSAAKAETITSQPS